MKPSFRVGFMRPSKRQAGKLLLASFCVVLLFSLSGCATKRLKIDFTGFEKAYAQTSNQELLLNLARLENRDPTYFFKIGQITSAYKMAVSLSGNAGYTLQSTNVAAGSPAGNGTPSATYENDPIFTFIPVNDETNAQLLLKPIPAESFYFLYEQGWRVDQLVRLMVDRFEVTRYDEKDHSCVVETIRNTPPSNYLRDGDALSSYTTFLRVNAIIYWLQRHGYLLLRGQHVFQPYSFTNHSGLDANDAKGLSANAPKGSDFVNAAQKGAVWELQPAKDTKVGVRGEGIQSQFQPLSTRRGWGKARARYQENRTPDHERSGDVGTQGRTRAARGADRACVRIHHRGNGESRDHRST